jgi:hypothetical protein
MNDKERVALCRNDNSWIPLVGEHQRWPESVVRFFWCPTCSELFAFVGGNEFGDRFAASFAYDNEQRRFVVWKRGDSPKDVESAEGSVSQVTFPSVEILNSRE